MSEDKNKKVEGKDEVKKGPPAIPQLQPQPEPQPSNMEVHKHPHHPTHKKKWGEYLVEFLMLFLAVFLGFLAENWREHIIENNRELEYIKSFYEDLTADERDLQSNINFLQAQMQDADSLQTLMSHMTIDQPANHIYTYLRSIPRGTGGLLFANDRTIVQLRNAGGMRLIRNKAVTDSMVGYYRNVEIVQFLQDEGLVNKRSLREKSMPLMNAEDFAKIVDSSDVIDDLGKPIYLRKVDPEIINTCLIEVNRVKTLNRTLISRIQSLRERAARIKTFIKTEYELK